MSYREELDLAKALAKAQTNRKNMLNEFNEFYQAGSALKHGLVGATLTLIAMAAAGAGIIITAVLPLMPVLPILAAITAGTLLSGFLIGMTARYLYIPSQTYINFYKEFETFENKLAIDNNLNKNGTKIEARNFISKRWFIKKWESECFNSDVILTHWRDEEHNNPRLKDFKQQWLKEEKIRKEQSFSNKIISLSNRNNGYERL